MKFNVWKGSRKKPTLDSTHSDRGKAADRVETLRGSYLGGKHKNKKMDVWLEPAEEGAANFRRQTAGPYTNYDKSAPPRVDGRRN